MAEEEQVSEGHVKFCVKNSEFREISNQNKTFRQISMQNLINN